MQGGTAGSISRFVPGRSFMLLPGIFCVLAMSHAQTKQMADDESSLSIE